MASIIWTKRAFLQLERNIRFIREDRGLSYASIVLDRILKNVSNLQEHPELGPREPLLKHKKFEYRFLTVWSYKIIYRVNKDTVVIARVFHTSRNPAKLKGV